MRIWKCVQTLLLLLPIIVIVGCGSSSPAANGSPSGSVYTVATDASLPSVVSCQLTINTVTLFNGTTNVSVLSSPVVEDFARLNGLHDLLDLNAVPVGTYTSATITLGSAASIGYIDTTVNPPAIHTITGNLSQITVTVPFITPFTLNAADLVGLRMEFDIAQSLPTDNTGQITGTVNPTFDLRLLNAADSNVSIDDFRGGYIGAGGTPNMFVMQGPLGRQWNVSVDGNTSMDTGDQIASFTTNSIVQVSGQLNPVTKSIDAAEVSLVSNDKFLMGGLFTSIRPPSGAATAADMYIRSELPAPAGIEPGQITTITLNGTEVYRIACVPQFLSILLFSNTSLAAGQHVEVGGVLQTVNGVTTLIPHRIILARQGQSGAWVPNSTKISSGNQGTFQLTDKSTAGVLLPNPLTIISTVNTRYIGLSGLSALSGSAAIPLRVVGYVLVDSSDPYTSTRDAVLVARYVEALPAH
jgi:hypothetical protein